MVGYELRVVHWVRVRASKYVLVQVNSLLHCDATFRFCNWCCLVGVFKGILCAFFIIVGSGSLKRVPIKTGNYVQDCPNSWCIVKTKDPMERQEHCPKLQNQNDAFIGHFNLPVRVRKMDPYSRVREEDTSYRNEMLPKTAGHLIQGSC